MNFTTNSKIRNFLNQEFQDIKHKDFRKWFFTHIAKTERQNWKAQYYDYLQKHQKIEFFVPWFLSNYIQQQNFHIGVLEEHFKAWKTNTGAITRSIYPPTDPLRLTGLYTSNLEASAFIKPNDSQDEILKELSRGHNINKGTGIRAFSEEITCCDKFFTRTHGIGIQVSCTQICAVGSLYLTSNLSPLAPLRV